MSSPWPTPIPAFSSLGGKIEPWNVKFWAQAALQYVENVTSAETWRRLEVKYLNTATGAQNSDSAWTTFDLINITGGQVDSSWTSTDYSTCEAAFDTLFNTYASYCPLYYTVAQYRWYVKSFTDVPTAPIVPPDRDKPFNDSGPPEHVTSKNIIGTGAGTSAPQLAFTITEKTDWPHHWGRNYFPFSAATNMTTAGRIGSTAMTALVTAMQTCHTTLAGNDFQFIVPVTTFDKQPVRTFLQVKSLQIDDTVDIIRRRRWKTVLTRVTKP